MWRQAHLAGNGLHYLGPQTGHLHSIKMQLRTELSMYLCPYIFLTENDKLIAFLLTTWRERWRIFS